jgi:hypothetical protein
MINSQSKFNDFVERKPYNTVGDKLIDFSTVGSHKYPIINTTIFVSPMQIFCENNYDDYICEIMDFSQGNIEIIFEHGKYLFSKPLNINHNNIILTSSCKNTTEKVSFVFNCASYPLLNISANKWFTNKYPLTNISNTYVPVGSRKIRIPNSYPLKVNDTIRIVRKCNNEWISTIGMNHIYQYSPNKTQTKIVQWIPFNLEYDRRILNIFETSFYKELLLDEDIPCAIDYKWGGGQVYKYDNSRIYSITISNIDFQYISNKDNSPNIITIDNAEHIILDTITCNKTQEINNFISIGTGTKNITLNKCICNTESSNAFKIAGQLHLIRNCESKSISDNPIIIESYTCGPNVIYKFMSKRNINKNSIISYGKWSVGCLYDSCNCPISICNKNGWNLANSTVWNCRNNDISLCSSPPTTHNFGIGIIRNKSHSRFSEDTNEYSSENHVQPKSIYSKQFQDLRMKKKN